LAATVFGIESHRLTHFKCHRLGNGNRSDQTKLVAVTAHRTIISRALLLQLLLFYHHHHHGWRDCTNLIAEEYYILGYNAV
jgi:hypothetical protein